MIPRDSLSVVSFHSWRVFKCVGDLEIIGKIVRSLASFRRSESPRLILPISSRISPQQRLRCSELQSRRLARALKRLPCPYFLIFLNLALVFRTGDRLHAMVTYWLRFGVYDCSSSVFHRVLSFSLVFAFDHPVQWADDSPWLH